MTRHLVLLLSCCLPLSALAQSAPSPAADPTANPGAAAQGVASASDPARQALDAWLAAFNANDRKQLEAFRDRYQPTLDVDRMLDFHRRTGGFKFVQREPSDPGSAQVLVQEAASDTVARVTVTVKAGAPLDLQIEAIQRPDDLRIPRLEQAAAIDGKKGVRDIFPALPERWRSSSTVPPATVPAAFASSCADLFHGLPP